MRVLSVLRSPVGPTVHLRRRMTLVLCHVVARRRVGRVVAGEGGTGRGDRGIYRYVRVRFHVWSVVMVMLVSILQRHGRTCCLSHISCAGARMVLMMRVLLLTRQVVGWEVGGTRRGCVDAVIGGRRGRRREVCRSDVLLRRVGELRSRCLICGWRIFRLRVPERKAVRRVQTWLRVFRRPSVHQLA